MKRINAFTLMELLVVLFIIGIILTITLPSFGPMINTMKLNTAAETLLNTMEAARQYAVTSAGDCYVIFPAGDDGAYSSYRMYNPSDGTVINREEALPKSVEISTDSTFLGDTMDVEMPEQEGGGTRKAAYIRFTSGGAAYVPNGGSGSVYLKEANSGISRRIIFYSVPAECRIEE